METIQDWIAKLKEFDGIIIVEGPKDKKTLTSLLGFKKIFVLSKKPLYAVVEKIAKETKDVVILTDLDEKGKELFGRLRSNLQKHGVRINRTFREFLFRKTNLSHVEGLGTYIRNQ
jgi:5S rRNA maturation endonuclease (ribonuclease M5)